MRMFQPPHPGEVLREFLGETSISAAAAHLGVSRATLSRVLNGHHGISAGMALRLGEALETTPESWLDMQVKYDLAQAATERRKPLGPLLKMAA
jgi:addiction module HigA family antidote